MVKKSIFTRNGRQYEVMQPGLSHVPKNSKACIRPKGSKTPITIDDAIAHGLIRDVGPSEDLLSGTYNGKSPLKDGKSESIIPQAREPAAVRAAMAAPKTVTFYLPVAQLRAQVYLAHGIIFPAAYDSGNAPTIRDVQARVPHSLALWREQPPIGKGELLFGLRLSPEEIEEIGQQNEPILWPSALPISRLTEIIVPAQNEDELLKYRRSWIESDVPVPARFFTAALKVEEASATVAVDLPPETAPAAKDSEDIRHTLKQYDRIMGLFSYMRNAARYHSSRLGFYADCPAQFIRLAHCLNNSLDMSGVPSVPISPSLKALLDNQPVTEPVIDALRQLVLSKNAYIEKNAARPVAEAIAATCGPGSPIPEAFRQLFDDDYRAAIKLLQKEPQSEIAIMLATLFKFSDKQSNDHRNIKSSLHLDLTSLPIVASSLGMLGAYYGYTALDAQESRLYALDRRLTQSVAQRPFIKFHLETRFERELIESIYQWTFFHRFVDASISALFADLALTTPERPAPPMPLYWKDESYLVGDLWVRNYKLTPFARFYQRIEELAASHIDESSILGQYLTQLCFFQAEEYDLSKRNGRDTLHYRISKQRLLDLLSEEKIRINPKVGLVALEEDALGRK